MQIVTHDELVRALEAFGAGHTTVDEFNQWLTPLSWEMPAENQDSAAEAIFEAELCLAEFDSGQRTETELREAMAKVAQELREEAAA